MGVFSPIRIRVRVHLTVPKLHLARRFQRAAIRLILAALFIARAEIRAMNVQGMLVSWFRFCPDFRDAGNKAEAGCGNSQGWRAC